MACDLALKPRSYPAKYMPLASPPRGTTWLPDGWPWPGRSRPPPALRASARGRGLGERSLRIHPGSVGSWELEHHARDAVERLVDGRDDRDARDRRRGEESEYRLAELQAVRDLGQRAVAPADRHQSERRARDDRVPRDPDAGGDRDRHPCVRDAPVAVRQETHDRAARLRCAARHGGHHADEPAAEEDDAQLGEPASEFGRECELDLGRVARTDHADRWAARLAALALEPSHRLAQSERRAARRRRAPDARRGIEASERGVIERALVAVQKEFAHRVACRGAMYRKRRGAATVAPRNARVILASSPITNLPLHGRERAASCAGHTRAIDGR